MEKTCSECSSGPIIARGYCGKCYQRWKKYGNAAESALQRHPRKGSMCTNCGDPVSPSSARGYCDKCYKRWQTHGDPSFLLPPSPPPVNRKYALNHEYFDDISTPEQAYWLGLIAADGSVEDSARTYALRLDLAEKDAEHVRLFALTLGSDKIPQFYKRPASKFCKARTGVYVQLDSRQLVESLRRVGIGPRKSATVEPWDGPADLMPHYWRGLFDGDGCIHHRGRGSGTSWALTQVGSEACVVGFTEWARSVCDTKSTPRHITGGCWQLAVEGSHMSQKLVTALYQDAGDALPRKFELAAELMAARFARPPRQQKSST